MIAQALAPAPGFHADQLDFLVLDELVKDADGIRSAADAGDDRLGKLAFGLKNLLSRFAPGDLVKVAHHGGIRMRSQHAAQQVMRGAHVGHPVAHGFVDRVLQGAGTRIHAADFRAQQPHAEDVELLPPHVFRPHVHDAFKAQQRAHRGGGHAMLPGAGLGDDAMLAHAFNQQRLSQTVVDLVRAGMKQVFALEINLCPAQLFGEALGKEQRRGAAGVGAQQFVQAASETCGPAWLSRSAAPVRRAPPSASRGHSVRHTRRSVRLPSLRRTGWIFAVAIFSSSCLPAEPPLQTREFSPGPFFPAWPQRRMQHPLPRASVYGSHQPRSRG